MCVPFLVFVVSVIVASPDANRLFEDLLGNYHKLSRPVKESDKAVEIQFKMKLLQILDVVCSKILFVLK